MSRFVLTCGDTNGIGPEIVIKSLNRIFQKRIQHQFYFICPANVFRKTIKKIKPRFKYEINDYTPEQIQFSAQVLVLLLPDVKMESGKPTRQSGEASFKSLQLSFELLKNKSADAVITAPVSKTALKLAGKKFPGQTEMFAKWSGQKEFVMTFFSKKINVALYSIHIPLKNVSKSLNLMKLLSVVKIISRTLKLDIGIRKPAIAVLGLNPHAGETGLIGNEEKKIIVPFMKKYSGQFNLSGPFSPDAFFANKLYSKFDMVLGLYHDQVLIPFKYMNQFHGVNYTAGLKIVRTSPDHGVAYDIAGKNIADPISMIEAFYLAEKIVKNRKKVNADF